MPVEETDQVVDSDTAIEDQKSMLPAETPGQEPVLVPLVERMLAEMASLRSDFDAKIRYDKAKEQQVESMSSELEEHRAGLHRRLLKPVLTDLVALHDDITEMLRDHSASDDSPAGAGLHSLRDSIEETLLRNGVSSFTGDTGEVDRSRQKVIEVVSTDTEELDRTVQRRLRPGFEYDDGMVLRPEWVAAYRYVPSNEPA